MNKTTPSYDVPVTEQELAALVEPPVPVGACCSIEKPKEITIENQPTQARSGCCCH